MLVIELSEGNVSSTLEATIWVMCIMYMKYFIFKFIIFSVFYRETVLTQTTAQNNTEKR